MLRPNNLLNIELLENKIYCSDNLAFSRIMRDEIVDLSVLSPEYGNMRDYDQNQRSDVESLARELFRITRPGGVVVWIVQDQTEDGNESGVSFEQALHFKKMGFNLFDTMIYEKSGAGNGGSKLGYWQAFEYMFVFSKERPKTINLIKDKYNKTHGESGGARRGKDGEFKDRDYSKKTPKFGRRSNIWRYPQGHEDEFAQRHPAVFPLALARDHVLTWSNSGDLVFDCYSGSGTTAVASWHLGRRFLACDISKSYVELAQRRLEYYQARPPLFVVEANGETTQLELTGAENE